MSDFLHCPGVLALELAAGARPERLNVSRDDAADLAACIAADLERLVPGAAGAHLVVGAGLYDLAQLLRPGWPIYATLADLASGAPRDAAHVIAFGTDADENWPSDALAPEPALIGSGATMLVLPWLLLGPEMQVQELGGRMERDFLAKGEAGTQTSDVLMRRFGMRCEHVRYLTRHDLCALACVQLEHAGFAAAWALLETALLAPDDTQDALTARGRAWRYAVGSAHTTSPSYEDWYAAYGAMLTIEQRAHAYAGWLFELRQYAALFQAHRLPLLVDGADADAGYVLEPVADPRDDLEAPRLYAHEAPGLGVVVLTVAQPAPGEAHVVAHGYPLSAHGLVALRGEFAARYGTGTTMERLGRLQLDFTGMQLDVPATRSS